MGYDVPCKMLALNFHPHKVYYCQNCENCKNTDKLRECKKDEYLSKFLNFQKI